MSTAITNTQLTRVARFYESTIGKKAVMAVTGLVLFGFLVAHMLGNLQIFLGPAVMKGIPTPINLYRVERRTP